jgi:hypothetical protein
MNIFKTLTVSVSVVMLLLTPLGAVKQADSAPAGKPYTMATAGTGGTFYVLGGAFSDMLRKHANTKMTPIVTNGSIENNRLVGTKRVAMAINYPDLIYYAYHGQEMYKGTKFDNLRYVGGGTGATQVIVPMVPDQKLKDLKGKPWPSAHREAIILPHHGPAGGCRFTSRTSPLPVLSKWSALCRQHGRSSDPSRGHSRLLRNGYFCNKKRLVPYTADEVNAYIAKQGPKRALLFLPSARKHVPQSERSRSLHSVRACIVTHKDVPDEPYTPS